MSGCSAPGCVDGSGEQWRVFSAYETTVDDSPHDNPHPLLRRYPHAQGAYCARHLIDHLRDDPNESFYVVPVQP